jgi:hypothetical protein
MPCPYKGFPKLALLANINNASHDEPLGDFFGYQFSCHPLLSMWNCKNNAR